MELAIEDTKSEGNMDSKAYREASEQYKKAAGKPTELAEMRVHQGKGKRQDTSYNRVSIYGDTLSISEEGRIMDSGKKFILETVH